MDCRFRFLLLLLPLNLFDCHFDVSSLFKTPTHVYFINRYKYIFDIYFIPYYKNLLVFGMPNPVLANATNILKASSVRPVRVVPATATAFGVPSNAAASAVHPG